MRLDPANLRDIQKGVPRRRGLQTTAAPDRDPWFPNPDRELTGRSGHTGHETTGVLQTGDGPDLLQTEDVTPQETTEDPLVLPCITGDLPGLQSEAIVPGTGDLRLI